MKTFFSGKHEAKSMRAAVVDLAPKTTNRTRKQFPLIVTDTNIFIHQYSFI